MSICILNKISALEAKSQNRVESAFMSSRFRQDGLCEISTCMFRKFLLIACFLRGLTGGGGSVRCEVLLQNGPLGA